MRRRQGIFLQKAMAVLLSALLCVGLIVGAGPMDTWAEEETPMQTAYLIVEFDGSTVVPTVEMDVHLKDDSNKVYSPSSSSKAGSVTYKVEGLMPNQQYYWIIDGTTIPFKRDSSEYTVVRTLYAVKYMDSGKVLHTQYVAYGGKAQPPSNPTKEGYTFVRWQASNGTEFSFDTSIIKESTWIYAAWKRIISNDALGSRLEEVLGYLSVTDNTKTNEAIVDDVKKNITSGIDQTFDIKSAVTVKITERENATNEKEGSIKLEVSVTYGGYSATREQSISIPRQGEEWILYNSGYLSIRSQKGMDDWVQNGRRGTNNLSDVETIYISYYDVKEIPEDAFNGCNNLAYVSIPGTVTSIGDRAFYNCSSLRTVEMRGEEPPKFEGDSFLDGCSSFTGSSTAGSIMVPSGCGEKYKDAVGEKFARFVKEVAPPKSEVTEAALSEKLQEILNELPVSNSTTMDAAMRDVKKALDDYFLNTSTIQAGYYALTRANYEKDGLIVLEMTAFCDRYSVTKQVTKSVPKLTLVLEEDWLLDEDGNLVISGQKGMDGWVNNGRTEEKLPAVKNVLIWGDVTEIPDNAFSNCSNLEYASVSKTVTSIGNSAFAGCNSLEKVVMQGTTPPTSIGNSAFDGCKFVTDPDNTEGIVVPPGSEDAYSSAGEIFKKYIKAEKPEVTEEALNSKLQEILGELSVSNDTTEETVKAAVKGVIDGFFKISSIITIGEFKITEATIEKEGSLELAITVGYGECLAKAEETIPIAKLPPLPDRGWALDEAGKLVIGSQAGMDDWTLNGRAEGRFPAVKNVLIQGDVTSIPDDAFSGCSDLETVVIPDTVTSIGSLAFKHASSLSEITLPPNLQSIGDSAFSDCSSLEKVVMQGTTPPSLGSSVFDQCKFVEDSSRGIVVPQGSEDTYREAWGALGDNILEKHTHSYDAEWNYDETGHWHECSCGGKGDMAVHVWGEGSVTKEPTEVEPGAMSFTCSVCGMGKSESIPATGSSNGDGDGGNGDGDGDGGNGGSGDGDGGNGGSGDGDGGNGGSGDGDGGNGGSGGGNGANDGQGGTGDGMPSVSGNGNQGGDGNGTVSGNDNPGGGGDISVSGNDNSGGGGNDGGSPAAPENSNQGSRSSESDSLPSEDNSSDLALFWNTLTASAPKDAEPRTADGVPLELYATVAMIAGFFYLLLLFLDKYDITQEERRESLARLVRWAKSGGWLRKLPVIAVLLLMRTYYRIVGGQRPGEKKV